MTTGIYWQLANKFPYGSRNGKWFTAAAIGVTPTVTVGRLVFGGLVNTGLVGGRLHS